MHRFRRLPHLLVPAAAAAALSACTDGDRLTQPDPVSLVDYADPAALALAQAEALNTKDVARYVALLEAPSPERTTGFEYFRPLEAYGFPWGAPDRWGYSDEVRIVAHLFDADRLNPYTDYPYVDTIRMDLQVLEVMALTDGRFAVTCAVQIRVLRVAWPDATFDSVFELEMAPDARGFLRIRRIEEDRAPGNVGISWGAYKATFL